MKFIGHENVNGDFNAAVTLLLSKGVLATSTESYANIPTKSVPAKSIKQGIWITLDHQYEDAVEILNNPEHEAATALTPNEIKALSEAASEQLGMVASKYFYIIFGLVIFFIIVAWFYIEFTRR